MKRRIASALYIAAAAFILSVVSFASEAKVLAAGDTERPTIKIVPETQEPAADSVKVTVTVTDNKGVQEFRYASGKRSTAYFKERGYGKAVALKDHQRTFRIQNNKTYTFYAVDAAGNTRVRYLTVQNIDKEAPKLQVTLPEVDGYTNKNQELQIQATDDLSGVETVRYAAGAQEAAFFAENGTEVILNQEGKGTVPVTKNGIITLYARDLVGHEITTQASIGFLDKKAPECQAEYEVSRQTAKVTLSVQDNLSGIAEIRYQPGAVSSKLNADWKTAELVDNLSFEVKKSGTYTVRIKDQAGNRTLTQVDVQMEFRAVWITYIEYAPSFKYTKYTYSQFKEKIDTMFDDCVTDGMTAVIVQVRPFSDALYQSDYFPWSGYISGKQGRDPGYDPMEYMVEAAHDRGLEFHAYLNPYRVEAKSNYSLLSKDNPARRWLEDDDPENDRNVLLFGDKYYYNPAREEVQELILNGVKEIVEKYDVDGIHFDDYFYPTLGSNYAKLFDYVEYKEYASVMKASGEKADDIATWRRNNVSNLVSDIYSAIKKIDPSVVFGISPAGNLNNLRANDRYYVDVDRWLSEDGFIDYICPQIYWGFEHSTCPFAETTDKWISIMTNPNVRLYVGLPLYNAGTGITDEWKNNSNIIARQVKYLRNTGFADGFFLYRYDFLNHSRSEREMINLRKLLIQ